MTRDEIFTLVRQTMIEMFEVEPDAIRLEAKLGEDLDLDSIDAIDIAAKLQQMTGRKVDESSLRGLRTVGDVIDLIERLTAPKD